MFFLCLCCLYWDEQKRYTALIWAACKGHTDCVRVLVDGGADKEAMDQVLIIAASFFLYFICIYVFIYSRFDFVFGFLFLDFWPLSIVFVDFSGITHAAAHAFAFELRLDMII